LSLLEPIGYVPLAEFEAAWCEAVEKRALRFPKSPTNETGGTKHPGNEASDEHGLAASLQIGEASIEPGMTQSGNCSNWPKGII
jgi:hypothetical protein